MGVRVRRDEERDDAAAVLHDRLDSLYLNSSSALAITVVASAGLTLGFIGSNLYTAKLLWWLMMLLVTAGRALDMRRWHAKCRRGERGDRRDLYCMTVGVIATALTWSSYATLFNERVGLYEMTAVMVIISALAGGATTVLSANVHLSRAYSAILILPYSAMMLAAENAEHRVLGVLGLCFAWIMYQVAGRAAEFTNSSIQLRYEHLNLLRNLESEVESRTARIVELSQKDTLTRMLNRRAFMIEARRRLTEKQADHQVLAFIDLDGFKPINDSYGHAVGDEVLGTLAERLKAFSADQHLACRWGGDEFIVMAEVRDEAHLQAFASELLALFDEPLALRRHSFVLEASIGLSRFPARGEDIDERVSQADQAMYHCKQGSRHGCVRYDETLELRLRHERELESALPLAIANNQLFLVFQPLVDAADGRYVAAEALLRWKLDGQLIPPDEFIPLAEKSGAICEIGYWVLEQSLARLCQLHRQGFEIALGVNVSVVQFEDPDFVSRVLQIVEQQQVESDWLRLEITESVLSRDARRFGEAVQALHDAGVRIAVDDFGTGYSSLSVIQNLQVDYVKIDRSFVDRLEHHGLDVVQAVMVMARGMGYSVVAEGVETARQAETLRKLGVDYLQGYFYDRPLPFEALRERLLTREAQGI